MDTLLYWLARLLVAVVQALPLRLVARLGRAGGALACRLDARHRRVAIRSLTLCFGTEKSPDEIRALAAENFRRIGENFACAVKCAAMSAPALRRYWEGEGIAKLATPVGRNSRNVIVAIGHFGNFELYARFCQELPEYQAATTYRSLRPPALNRLLQELRQRSGCLFFDRLTQGRELKAALRGNNLLLGLLADQHAGQSGYRLPFLGRDCSTALAPAVLAQRYDCPLFTAICYRTGLARWRVEVGDEIPTRDHGRPRAPADIMLDVHRAFEAAVRRDPANWFWVHNRWKTPGREPKTALQTAAPSPTVEPESR